MRLVLSTDLFSFRAVLNRKFPCTSCPQEGSDTHSQHPHGSSTSYTTDEPVLKESPTTGVWLISRLPLGLVHLSVWKDILVPTTASQSSLTALGMYFALPPPTLDHSFIFSLHSWPSRTLYSWNHTVFSRSTCITW